MEIDFVKLMATKTDEGLQECIDNRQKYSANAIYAAVDELKMRGRSFTDEEFTQIVNDIEKQEEISKQRVAESESSSGSKYWNKNVVDDPLAPEFYSERAIFTFSVFFSVFAGSVLMAMNIYRTEKKHSYWKALAFGLIYTTFQMYILSSFPTKIPLTFSVTIGGVLLLNLLFYNRYIGKDTKFRARPLLIPVVVAFIITLPLFLIAFFFGSD